MLISDCAKVMDYEDDDHGMNLICESNNNIIYISNINSKLS